MLDYLPLIKGGAGGKSFRQFFSSFQFIHSNMKGGKNSSQEENKLTNHKKDLQAKAQEEKYTLGIAQNVRSIKLKRKTFSRSELLKEMTSHEVCEQKNGISLYLQGDIRQVGKSKNIENLQDIQIFVVDFDNEERGVLTPKSSSKYVSMENAVKLLSDTSFCAAVASTHSHMKKRDTEKGRFVIPLKTPFEIDKRNPSYSKQLWKEISKLIMKSLKFPSWDSSGDRLSQSFYFPSCPSSYAHKKVAQIVNPEGELLDWKEFEASAKLNLVTSHIVASVDEEKALKFEHVDCRLFLKVFPNFDLIKAHGDHAGRAVKAGRAITCPFDSEHSSTGSETKTVIYNKNGDNPGTWNCQGGSCEGRTREQYLYKSLQNGTLTIEQLEDVELGGGTLDALKSAEKVNKETSPEEIEEMLRISSLVNSAMVHNKVKNTIVKKTEFTVSQLNAVDRHRDNQTKIDAKKRAKKYQEKMENEEELFIANVLEEYNAKFAYLRYGESSVAVLVQEHDKNSFMSLQAFNAYYRDDFITFNDATMTNTLFGVQRTERNADTMIW